MHVSTSYNYLHIILIYLPLNSGRVEDFPSKHHHFHTKKRQREKRRERERGGGGGERKGDYNLSGIGFPSL